MPACSTTRPSTSLACILIKLGMTILYSSTSNLRIAPTGRPSWPSTESITSMRSTAIMFPAGSMSITMSWPSLLIHLIQSSIPIYLTNPSCSQHWRSSIFLKTWPSFLIMRSHLRFHTRSSMPRIHRSSTNFTPNLSMSLTLNRSTCGCIAGWGSAASHYV